MASDSMLAMKVGQTLRFTPFSEVLKRSRFASESCVSIGEARAYVGVNRFPSSSIKGPSAALVPSVYSEQTESGRVQSETSVLL